MAPVYTSTSSCPTRPRVVAIGNFDGVHRGHQAVLQAGKRMAHRLGASLLACTFDPAPTAVLSPDRHQPRICHIEDRVHMLGEAGADEVLVQPFTVEFSQQNPAWFFGEFLIAQLHAVGVVVGHDFRFGRGRAADAAQMMQLAAHTSHEVTVEVLPALTAEAEGASSGIIASSRIRRLVRAGEVGAAAALLGRSHFLRGLVVHGDKRGRELGFPTANLDIQTELLPKDGVYACRVHIDGGIAARPAVANFGFRPTFAGLQHRIEVHLLDYSGDLYGRQLCVELIARVRDEKRFDGLEALKQQIHQDVIQARALLGVEGGSTE